MTRSTQVKTDRIIDSSGNPRLGVAVELRRGALSIGMVEVGDGYYKADAVPPGQYAVVVGAVDTGSFVAVGAGELDAPDYENNPNKIMQTSAVGVPEWETLKIAENAILKGSATGEASEISASADHHVLRRSGVVTDFGLLAFDSVNGLQTALDSKADDTDLDSFVPYTGATSDVDLGSQKIKINGATYFGRLASEPTPLLGGDSYFNTTNNIPYIWDGTDWLELTAGSSFGQLRTTRNATAQTGITSAFTKVTQYTTNGIEEGSVSVDLPNDTMTLGDGIYEFEFGHDMTTTSSNVLMTFSVFDVLDTTFTNPFLEINRKIGTGSDVGAMGISGLDTIVGTTTIALFVKADKNTDMTLTNATLKVIKIK